MLTTTHLSVHDVIHGLEAFKVGGFVLQGLLSASNKPR